MNGHQFFAMPQRPATRTYDSPRFNASALRVSPSMPTRGKLCSAKVTASRGSCSPGLSQSPQRHDMNLGEQCVFHRHEFTTCRELHGFSLRATFLSWRERLSRFHPRVRIHRQESASHHALACGVSARVLPSGPAVWPQAPRRRQHLPAASRRSYGSGRSGSCDGRKNVGHAVLNDQPIWGGPVSTIARCMRPILQRSPSKGKMVDSILDRIGIIFSIVQVVAIIGQKRRKSQNWTGKASTASAFSRWQLLTSSPVRPAPAPRSTDPSARSPA